MHERAINRLVGGVMKHFYSRNDTYYILDTNNLKFYKFSQEYQEKLKGDIKFREQLLSSIQNQDVGMAADPLSKVIKSDNNLCNRLILNLSELCNLGCKYCYAKEGGYGQEIRVQNMSMDTMKQVVTKTLELYPAGIYQIQFFGGEPMLNKEVMYRGVKWITDYFDEKNLKRPLFTMVTNGTLISDEDIELFNKYFNSITISLDGSKSVNDDKRRFKNGKDSVFDRVITVIENINRTKRNFYLCIEGTIHQGQIKEYKEKKEMVSFHALHNLNVDIVHISPQINSSESSQEIRNEFNHFFEKWVEEEFKNGVENIKTRVVADILYASKEKKSFGNGCGATCTDIASDVYGNLYPCFMFIGALEYKIGSVKDEICDLKNINSAVRDKLKEANDNSKCINCWVKPICMKSYGHCIGARYLACGDIKKPQDEICDISRTVLESTFALADQYHGVTKREENKIESSE